MADLSVFNGLTEEQRLGARLAAREAVRARVAAPVARTVDNASGLPAGAVVVTLAGVVVLVVAQFIHSAIRLYQIGYLTEAGGFWLRVVSALSVVLGSEAGAIGFALAAGVLAVTRGERAVFWALSFASTALAVVGNVQLVLGGDWWRVWVDPFRFIDAVLPPVVVLGGALVVKTLLLRRVVVWHESQREYGAALAVYQAAIDNPESAAGWDRAYAGALRDALRRVNLVGRGASDRRVMMEQMTAAEWRALVRRELAAEDWSVESDLALPLGNGKGNGHSGAAVIDSGDYIVIAAGVGS